MIRFRLALAIALVGFSVIGTVAPAIATGRMIASERGECQAQAQNDARALGSCERAESSSLPVSPPPNPADLPLPMVRVAPPPLVGWNLPEVTPQPFGRPRRPPLRPPRSTS
jgi:hypothetical protein